MSSKDISYRHETEVAALFSAWWGRDFARTPNSGALRWNGLTWTFGDILPPENFHAVIECKRRSPITWHGLFDPRLKIHEHHPLSWWQQAIDDSLRAYTELDRRPIQPIVVCKTVRGKNRIFLDAEFYGAMGGRKLGLWTVWVTNPDCPPFVLLDLQSFFETVSKEVFQASARKVIPTSLVESAA